MVNEKTSRREFLRGTIMAAGAVILPFSLGCGKKHGKKDNRFRISCFEGQMPEKWGPVLGKNSLEDIFAFDFGEGLEFEKIEKTEEEEYFIDAIGFNFEYSTKDQKKLFTIAGLSRNERGYSIDLIEGNQIEMLELSRHLIIENGTNVYDIAIKEIKERKGFFSVPEFLVEVNGKEVLIGEKGALIEGINLVPDLKFYYDNRGNSDLPLFGSFPFFISGERFSTRHDCGNDVVFSGLEHIIELKGDRTIKQIREENRYNEEVQEDSFVRFLAEEKDGKVILRKLEKIRETEMNGTSGSYRPASSFEILVKEVEREKPFRDISEYVEVHQTLEGNFSFDFREKPIVILPDLNDNSHLNNRFSFGKREFLIRYVDISYLPIKSSFPLAFYPMLSATLEIIENPVETYFYNENYGLCEWKSEPIEIVIGDERYIINLRKADNNVFNFDIEKNGIKKSADIRFRDKNGSNTVLGLNIDPDLLHYEGTNPECADVHRFFLSNSRFSASTDFFDDARFTGLKKVPGYTYSNRHNGKIQNAYVRIKGRVPLRYHADSVDAFCLNSFGQESDNRTIIERIEKIVLPEN